MSTRMPIFRSLPRVGIPPYFDGWAGYERRIETMVASGVIADYTYLWWDVRPHPNLGTVEIRAMDAQTRADDTITLVALTQSLVAALLEGHRRGERVAKHPAEMLDENKWLAARYGLDAQLVDLPGPERCASTRRTSAPPRGWTASASCSSGATAPSVSSPAFARPARWFR